MRFTSLVAAAFAAGIAACGGPERSADGQDPRSSASPPATAPGGEILFELPRGTLAGDAGGPPLPTDRDELYALAREKLSAGELDEALAYVDTLLVMAPGDPELLEFRGEALVAQGHPEDARADFERCCELGRRS